MPQPLAYLLTWTCYGTWLHGDQRGSVDADHNAPGAPFLPPDSVRLSDETRASRFPSMTLSGAARRIVEKTIEDHCQHRGWMLHVLAVRSNHIHVVVSCSVDPKRAINEMKAWATRRLRDAKIVSADAHVWTEGGSRRYLWNGESLRRAIGYVSEYQGNDLA